MNKMKHLFNARFFALNRKNKGMKKSKNIFIHAPFMNHRYVKKKEYSPFIF